MNDVRVRPIRDKADGRINMYAVDARKDGAFENVAAFSSWDRAHNFAHRLPASIGRCFHAEFRSDLVSAWTIDGYEKTNRPGMKP